MKNTIGFVTGRKGCGKSTLVREVTREHRRVVIMDYVGEYGGNCGALVFEGFVPSMRALARHERARRFCLSLRIVDQRDALQALAVVYELRDVLLVVEEASWLCSPSYLPHELQQLVRLGRHREISQLYVAQRPVMVHRDVTSQADWIASFQQHGERDVRYLEDSVLADRAELVRELRPYELIAGVAPGEEAKLPACVKRRLEKQQRGRPRENALDSGNRKARGLKRADRLRAATNAVRGEE